MLNKRNRLCTLHIYTFYFNIFIVLKVFAGKMTQRIFSDSFIILHIVFFCLFFVHFPIFSFVSYSSMIISNSCSETATLICLVSDIFVPEYLHLANMNFLIKKKIIFFLQTCINLLLLKGRNGNSWAFDTKIWQNMYMLLISQTLLASTASHI